MNNCPNCDDYLVPIGTVKQFGVVSSFYKCKSGCNHVFEKIFDTMTQSYKYIDIHKYYVNVKENRIAE